MQKIIDKLVNAIAVIFGYKKTITDLTAENQKLRDELAAEAGDDAGLIAAKEAAEARATQLDADIAVIDAKADELAAAVNSEPTIPVEGVNFNNPATQPPVR